MSETKDRETSAHDTKAFAPASRLESRRRAFVDAAMHVFLEKGYANATLDDIIARSGGSRQTLYALFGGKQGLFEAIIDACNAEISLPFRAEDLLDRAPEDVLVAVGIRYLSLVLTPEVLGVYRLVLAEGATRPELAERFWALGPGRFLTALEAYFTQQAARGTLNLPDPALAARQLQGMLIGNYLTRCLLGIHAAPGPDEITPFVTAAITRFLYSCR